MFGHQCLDIDSKFALFSAQMKNNGNAPLVTVAAWVNVAVGDRAVHVFAFIQRKSQQYVLNDYMSEELIIIYIESSQFMGYSLP